LKRFQVSAVKQIGSTTERAKAKPATKAKQGQDKPTILLVDDDDTLRLLVKSRLEKVKKHLATLNHYALMVMIFLGCTSHDSLQSWRATDPKP
jgi:hypothetical protein